MAFQPWIFTSLDIENFGAEPQINANLGYDHATSPWNSFPDSKVHGAIMGPIWGRQDPGGPYIGPMNLAIWV